MNMREIFKDELLHLPEQTIHHNYIFISFGRFEKQSTAQAVFLA
jgi:hypothetical protein